MSAVDGEDLWPADLHLIGKEIVRFHAIFWPAFLMAGGLPLPKHIFAHGWLLFENDKMSKSRGNIVRAEPIRQVLGADALRYFLLREIVFGQDGSFSYDALVGRYNSDLANGLGNLASRTLTMIHQYRDGVIPEGSDPRDRRAAPTRPSQRCRSTSTRFEFSKGLEAVWALISAVDKFIVEQAPWKLAQADRSGVADRALRRRSTPPPKRCASPPRCSSRAAGIGAEDLGAARHARARSSRSASTTLAWGSLQPGQKIGEIAGVFPRIEAERSRRQDEGARRARSPREQNVLLGKKPAAAAPATPRHAEDHRSTTSSRWICASAWC